MKSEYTKEQISEAIQYWKGKLSEQEPVEEADMAGKLGKGLKAVGKFIAGDVKTTLSDMQASLFKTKGMKDFVKIMRDNQKNEGKDSYYDESDMIFAISLDGKFYNVADVELLGGKFWACRQPAVALLADFSKAASKTNDKKFMVADFGAALEKAKVDPSGVSSTYSQFILGDADAAAAKEAATSPEELGSPAPVSEAESADAPVAEPARTPGNHAIYLRNPFVKVYTTQGWIVFVFDKNEQEKKAAAKRVWG